MVPASVFCCCSSVTSHPYPHHHPHHLSFSGSLSLCTSPCSSTNWYSASVVSRVINALAMLACANIRHRRSRRYVNCERRETNSQHIQSAAAQTCAYVPTVRFSPQSYKYPKNFLTQFSHQTIFSIMEYPQLPN